MEREEVFRIIRKEKEPCGQVFQDFISPYMGNHRKLKEINEFPNKCEFVITKYPLKKKKSALEEEKTK